MVNYNLNQQLLIHPQLPTKKVQTQPPEIYVELLKQQKHQQKQNLQEKLLIHPFPIHPSNAAGLSVYASSVCGKCSFLGFAVLMLVGFAGLISTLGSSGDGPSKARLWKV